MRALQGSFGRLRLPLDPNNPERLLRICLHLHQLRTQCVGINQILNVYEPIWEEADGSDLWRGFEKIVCKEIRARDRVLRFHVVAMQQ